MQVNSIDTQVLIPRTTDASRTQSIRENQPIVQQDIGAMLIRDREQLRSKQVQHSEKSEGKRIKDEERGKNRRGSEKQTAAERKAAEEEEETIYMAVDAVRGHYVDISM